MSLPIWALSPWPCLRAVLVFCLLCFCPCRKAAAVSHAAYLNSLQFRCQEDYVFSATNTVFSVDIAYLPPEEVSIYLNSIPNNVELVSIKKVTYIPPTSSQQGYGTHVDVTVRFSSPGDVKLFAADLETKEGFFKVPFQSVHVWANMQILKPELSVAVDGQLRQGEPLQTVAGSHVIYTVRVKYALALKSISYEIPENSIFRELSRPMGEDEEPGGPGNFSPDFQDAVRYDWQPLLAGDCSLPAVNLVVQAYNGTTVSLPFPQIPVHVSEAEQSRGTAAADCSSPVAEAFAEAFAEVPLALQSVPAGASSEDAQLLAGLYSRELRSFPFMNAAMAERQDLERRLGLDVAPPLPRRPLFAFLLFVCLGGFVSVALFVYHKYFARAAFALMLSLLFSILLLIYAVRLSRGLAVSTGSRLYPIPEAALSQGGELPAASVVRILKRAGDWYYVSFNDTNGWISKNDVILIP